MYAHVIREYVRFELPFLWGSGQAAIADGTHIALLENNLLGAQHVRYGRFGGIAYHHISDTYIALFTHFIACGVWEAVYILDGLLKNTSDIQPDTLHADTQGHTDLIANAIVLQNVVDMTAALRRLDQNGEDLSAHTIAALSPYLRHHIKRFGDYVIDLSIQPEPLEKQMALPLRALLPAPSEEAAHQKHQG